MNFSNQQGIIISIIISHGTLLRRLVWWFRFNLPRKVPSLILGIFCCFFKYLVLWWFCFVQN